MQRIAIAPHQREGSIINFTPEQTHYLYRVLRLKEQDQVTVFDGSGKLWVVRLHKDQGQIVETITQNNELPTQVCLIVALTKGNGFDEVVRCCTELGVAEIMPVISDRCVVKANPKKVERWQRIAKEAAEQSERVIIPTIHPPRSWPETLITFRNYNLKLIASARYRQTSLLTQLQSQPNLQNQTIAIATGPEGGWTTTELDQAKEQGFQEIALGNRILRAVTAPITIMAIVSNFIEA